MAAAADERSGGFAALADRLAPAFAHIEERAAEARRTLRAWAQVNSGSLNLRGLDEMGRLAGELLAERTGAAIRRIGTPPVEMLCDDGRIESVKLADVLHAERRPERGRRLLLVGHLDTVFGPDDPFQTVRVLDDERWNGPGVADMKGGILVMALALAAFEESPCAGAIGWDVLLNGDEEIGSPASAPLLADFARRARLGLAFEPALDAHRLAGARKGSANIHYRITGRSAHAGRAFEQGRNALVAAADLALRLDALNGRRAEVTVNPAVMHAGGALNRVPDTAVLRVNIRVPDADARAWVEDELAAIERAVSARDGIALKRLGGFHRPPKPAAPTLQSLFAAVTQAGRALGLDLAFVPTGGCCDGNNLWAAGLPNVDTLGVVGGAIHSREEWIHLPSLAERAKLTLLIMAGFATGLIVPADDGAGEEKQTGEDAA
ncbi:MAG: acetylornithine deacetylase [Rhodothalassiaceae bacterium]|nr:MAG: acetylornithine deacetylase [Rhodothalassiaceae bacterium]